MSKKKAASTIGRGLVEGFIDFKLIKPNGEIVHKQHNTISVGARSWFEVKAVAPALAVCSNCGEFYVYHTVCPSCGYYRGKLAIEKEA